MVVTSGSLTTIMMKKSITAFYCYISESKFDFSTEQNNFIACFNIVTENSSAYFIDREKTPRYDHYTEI